MTTPQPQSVSEPASSSSRTSKAFPLGERPPLGVVPESMIACTVRPNRYGEPHAALRLEEVPVPAVGPYQVLVYVMAAGVNYNGVWAASGAPVDVIGMRARAGAKEDFHIGGSDGSGIVWAVGAGVKSVRVGDHVVLTPNCFDPRAQDILMGADTSTSTSTLAWGYETNYGSLAQYALVQEHQCLPKPRNMSWAEAGCYMLCAGTAYRQLMSWHPHVVRPGDPVLVWGGAGALGSMAIQIARHAGGIPVAVVSNEERAEHCMRLGAQGCVDRSQFGHWGRLPDLNDLAATKAWLEQVKAFGQRFWEALGERRNPRIVFEHSGAATMPTSLYVCDRAGMVVTCGGTSGYNGDFDLRQLWMRQKRIQGSHGAEPHEYDAVNRLIGSGKIDPCLSEVVPLQDAARLHQLMRDNRQPPGNMAVLIGALGDQNGKV